VFIIRSSDERNDNNVVTGKFPVNGYFVSILFDTGVDKSFISDKFNQLIQANLSPLEAKYNAELANGKLIETSHIVKDCELELSGHKLNIDLNPIAIGSFEL
jgi:hypothetical protein